MVSQSKLDNKGKRIATHVEVTVTATWLVTSSVTVFVISWVAVSVRRTVTVSVTCSVTLFVISSVTVSVT